MLPSSRRSGPTSPSAERLLLAVLLSGCASFGRPTECRQLRKLSPVQSDWEALRLADRCVQTPDLPDAERADALLQGAEIRSALGDAAGAEHSVRAALKLRPDDPKTLLRLAKLTRDHPEEAVDYAVKAGAWGLAGDIQTDLGDAGRAEASYRKALDADAGDLDALRGLARLKKGEDGRAWARQAAEAAAKAPAWCRGAALRHAALAQSEAGDPPGAMRTLGAALALDPDDIEALQAAAQEKRRHPEVPVRFPEEAGSTAPDERPKAASAKEAARFTATIPDRPVWQRYDAYRVAVEMWIDLKDEERARKTYERLINRDYQTLATYRVQYRLFGDPTRGSGELGRLKENVKLRRELGDVAGAEAAVARAMERFPNGWEPLQQMVALKLERKKPEQALLYAERLLAAYSRATPEQVVASFPNNTVFPFANVPDDERIRLTLKSNALLAERARSEKENRVRNAVETLAKIKLELGRAGDAAGDAAALEGLSERIPPAEKAAVYRKIAEIRRANGDGPGAEAALRAALAASPADGDTLKELTGLAIRRKDAAAALGYAERLAPAARRASALRDVAGLQRQLGDIPGAAASLKKAFDAAPDDPDVLGDACALALEQGRPDVAKSLAGRLEAAAARSGKAAAWRTLARVRSADRDAAGAEKALAKALDAAPADPDALRDLIDVRLAQGRAKDALGLADRLAKASEGLVPAERAESFRRAAKVRSAAGDAAGASADLESALALAPGDAATLRARFDLQLAGGDPAAAVTTLERLEKAAALEAREKGELHRSVARRLRAEKDAGGAEAEFRRVLGALPGDADARRALFELALEKGDAGEAKDRADALGPAGSRERAAAYREVADAQRRAGRAKAAEATLLEARRDAPEDGGVTHDLVALARSGGEAGLKRALELAPSDPDALRDAAALAVGKKDFAAADGFLRRLETALAGAPAAERAHAARRAAEVRRALKDDAGAEAALARALELAPGDWETLRDAVDLKLGQGKAAEARALAERLEAAAAAAGGPERPDLYRRVAQARRAAGDDSSASRGLQEAAEREPSLKAEASALRGDLKAAVDADAKAVCYSRIFQAGRDRLGGDFFEACLARFPRDAELYVDRGIVRFLAGLKEAAIADFRKALELQPGLPQAKQSLDTALRSK